MPNDKGLEHYKVILSNYLSFLDNKNYSPLDGSVKTLDDFNSHEFTMQMRYLREELRKINKEHEFTEYFTSIMFGKDVSYEEVLKLYKWVSNIIFENNKNIVINNSEKQNWNNFHRKITEWSKSRFDSKQYADAVEAAYKGINAVVKAIVKRKTGKELDGSSLMTTAFSVNSPIIVLDDMSNDSGRNIQQGYMQIFSGAMTGIRNPKAHAIITIAEKECIQLLNLADLLITKIEKTGEKIEEA